MLQGNRETVYVSSNKAMEGETHNTANIKVLTTDSDTEAIKNRKEKEINEKRKKTKA